MRFPPPISVAAAAEVRRRELPVSIAVVTMMGGIAAAITHSSAVVGWAAIMSLLLIFDAELYRRLERARTVLDRRTTIGLAAWAFGASAFYAVMPVVLWLGDGSAGAAAAVVMWVIGVVRHFSPGFSGARAVTLAGAAPSALLLALAPGIIALTSARPDWGSAAVAVIGGAALMAYVAQARLSASDAEREMQAKAAAFEMQSALASLLLDIEDAVVALIDRDGRVLAVNRDFEKRLEHAAPLGALFEEVAPFPKLSWRSAFEQSLAGQRVKLAREDTMLHVDGRFYAWETRPWRGGDGEIRGVFVTGRNVASLVEAQRAADAREEYLRIALDAAASAVWVIDFKTREITWYGDPVPLYGEPISFEGFDKGTASTIVEEDGAALAEYFRAIGNGASHTIEHRAYRGNGEIGWVKVCAKRVLGRSGGVRRLIVLSMDITERKRQEAAFLEAMRVAENTLRAKRQLLGDTEAAVLEPTSISSAEVNVEEMFGRLQRLITEMDARDVVLAETLMSLRQAREAAEEANASKSQFLASMSHELRTPLNAIIGYSEILYEEAEEESRASDMTDLDRVLKSARHLLHLINDILDLSKIEAGRMEIAAADFDIRALIEEAAATVRPAAEKNGNTLKVDVYGPLGRAHQDSFKINQCLLNLLANAAKFTRDGALVLGARRDVGPEGDWIELTVSDTGVGISEEQISRLFNAFSQADVTTAQQYGGTGLGLVLTRRMIELVGGEVSVQSALGTGSIFTLRFPAQAPGRAAVAAPSKPGPSALSGEGGGRIALVVDDEENARDLAARALERLGFVVRFAETGSEGLALARSLSPSLIILDINLPDQSGYDVLKALAEGETAGIPIIVHSVADDRERALKGGACHHLLKPAHRDALAAAALRFALTPAASGAEVVSGADVVAAKKTA